MKVNDLHADFVHKLKKLYGKFDENQNKFEKASNSEIARELGYSDAQFSRLINNSATEGEYKRAIQNTERIIHLLELEEAQQNGNQKKLNWKNSTWWFYGSVLLFLGLAVYTVSAYLGNSAIEPQQDDTLRYDMLRWTFENSFVNPYAQLDDLPEDCNYPCYKYQGKWTLKNGYKIPFFRERNGFHYLATEVIMYARCMSEKSAKGDILEGYEYQKHEIWYDKRELPIDSFVYNDGRLKEFYQDMDFKKNPEFVKVATVHTLFRDEFSIDTTEILRYGKVVGRDIEFASKDKLKEIFHDNGTIRAIENELNKIVTNRLKDFSRPISCNTAPVPERNFNEIKDGDVMSFDCQLTTSRMSVNYTKAFVLTDQYIKNTCQSK